MSDDPLLTERQRDAFREHFCGNIPSEEPFPRSYIFDVVLAIAGEKPCAFVSMPLGETFDESSPDNSDNLGEFLTDIDVPYFSREERHISQIETTDGGEEVRHNLWRREYYISTDEAIITEIEQAFSEDDDGVSHSRLGELLGFPQQAIEDFEREPPSKWKEYYYLFRALGGRSFRELFTTYSAAGYKPAQSIDGYRQAFEHGEWRRDLAEQLDTELGAHYFQDHVMHIEELYKLNSPLYVFFLFVATTIRRIRVYLPSLPDISRSR